MSVERFDELSLVFQNESISYEEIYKLNNTKFVTINELLRIISNILTEIVAETDK